MKLVQSRRNSASKQRWVSHDDDDSSDDGGDDGDDDDDDKNDDCNAKKAYVFGFFLIQERWWNLCGTCDKYQTNLRTELADIGCESIYYLPPNSL